MNINLHSYSKIFQEIIIQILVVSTEKGDFYWYADQHKHSDLLFADIHKIHYPHSGSMQYMQISHPKVSSASDVSPGFPKNSQNYLRLPI